LHVPRIFNIFKNDDLNPPYIPPDIFARSINKNLAKARAEYDEFILYVDREFGRFFNQLETLGILENTWLVLTSDHGEIHERGFNGHSTEALFQPLVRIPLIIFEPGRTTGMDIHEYTSAVDVLPTLAHVTGEPSIDWTEGSILPPYSPTKLNNRNIYSTYFAQNGKFDPLTIASVALMREGYKLHHYFGYPETPGDGLVRLYDIQADPHELTDLAQIKRETTAELLNELKTKLKEVDEPYRKPA
jgi:choline-sulfatase